MRGGRECQASERRLGHTSALGVEAPTDIGLEPQSGKRQLKEQLTEQHDLSQRRLSGVLRKM